MRATQAGKRQSVKRTLSPEAKAKAAESLVKARAARGARAGLHPEEDPMYPGYHTTVVPRLNPQDPKMSSPVGKYRGMGYTELSSDPEVTGHSDEVLMGIPIKDYMDRENARMAYHNGLMKDLMPSQMEMPEGPGQDVEVFFDRQASGLKTGEPISLAEAGASIGNTRTPAMPDQGD